MSNSDVKSKRVTTAASLGVGPARIRQVQVLTTAAGAGRLTITDGSGGDTVLDLDFLASDYNMTPAELRKLLSEVQPKGSKKLKIKKEVHAALFGEK